MDVKNLWDPAKVKLTSHKLASDVYAILPDDAFKIDHVGTTGGFIIGDKGVLVVESMVNGNLASQLIGEVRKLTTKPIRFLVNTSYHGDHCYGNFVFPEETVIIHHEATKKYIDEKFEQDRTFMLGLMGKEKGIEEVMPRSGDVVLRDWLSVDLGGKTVEVFHPGFGQTPGDVVVWLPKEKVVWTGNMVMAHPPAFPWLLEGNHLETIATMKKLHDFLPDDATIIPGHGKPMAKKDLNFLIEYVEKLHEEVQEAVAADLSLEKTVEKVKMTEYSHYSMYEFAHLQVNVPAVYKDLTS